MDVHNHQLRLFSTPSTYWNVCGGTCHVYTQVRTKFSTSKSSLPDSYGLSQNCEQRLLASSCPSLCTEQLGSHSTDFHDILYLCFFFRKSVESVHVSLNLTRIMVTLHGDVYTFMIISRYILLRVRKVSDKNCTENRNTYFICNNVFPKFVPLMK